MDVPIAKADIRTIGYFIDINLFIRNLQGFSRVTGLSPGTITDDKMNYRQEVITIVSMLDTPVCSLPHDIPDHMRPRIWRCNRETMVIDVKPRMENARRGAKHRLFATVPYIQPGT